MNDGIQFNGIEPQNGNAPQFDTDAFNRRFNEIMNGETAAGQPKGWKGAPARSTPQQTENTPPSPPKARPQAAKAPAKQKKKKKHTLRKIFAVLLALILIVTGTAAGAVLYVTSGYHAKSLEDNAYVSESSLMSSPAVTNILLMGIDTKDVGAQTRSDSMILMSIDTLHASIKLTSFMRDMYVEVPGHGETKLTHACAYAGPQLTVDTIELDFGVKIDGYAKIGYELFVELVNGVNGITVPEISAAESTDLAREGVYIDPGTDIHLNGLEALHYCRIRKSQTDFQRTERQREALTLIIKKALRTNPLKLLKLGKSLASQVECSIGKFEMIGVALKALPCLAGEIKQQQIPADGTWDNGTRDGMYVLLVDTDANRQVLKDFIY